MNFKINRKDFIDALTVGGMMANKARTAPVLENSKLTISNNTLTVQSLNLECSISKLTQVQSHDEDFEFLIDASNLLKVLKTLADIDIEASFANSILIVKHAKGVMEFPCLNTSNFPSMARGVGNEKFVNDIPCGCLYDLLSVGRNFVVEDALRPTLSGLNVFLRHDEMGVCATDAHKLYRDVFSVDYRGDDFSVIIPINAVGPLMSIIADSPTVNMIVDEKNITFTTSDSSLTCKMVEGNYPNVDAIIPKESSITVKVRTNDLVDTVRRVSMFANKTTSLIKLNIVGDKVSVNGTDIDFAKKAVETLDIAHSGEDLEIGVKADYFSVCLSTIQSEQVSICLKDQYRALILNDESRPYKTILLMPMMIS